MNRFLKKAVAAVLAVTMAFGGTVNAFADGGKEINLVSLGDSMTNGYGLPGYDTDDTDTNGYRDYGYVAYPNQLEEYLEEQGYNVNHDQLAMSAMRAEDLHFILEFPIGDTNAEAVANGSWDEEAWNATFSVGDYYTWNEFCDGRFEKIPGLGSTLEAAKQYQEAVANADIVTVGAGNANFGVFLLGRIMNAVGFDGSIEEDAWINYERALAECNDQQKNMLRKLKTEVENILNSYLGDIDAEYQVMADAMVNAVTYTVVSYALNYAGVLERIMDLNPDAEVILVGIMNTMAGMTFTMGEDEIDMTDMMALLVDPINAYIAALPTFMQLFKNGMYEDGKFYYAEAPTVECQVDTYKEMLGNEESAVRTRFVEEIAGEYKDNGNWENGMVWDLMNDGGVVAGIMNDENAQLIPVTLTNIKKYEAMTDGEKAAYAQENMLGAISCSLYLAFEDAIVKGSKNSVIPFESIMKLATGLDMTVFANTIDYFDTNIDDYCSKYIGSAAEIVAVASGERVPAELIEQMLGEDGETVILNTVYQLVAAQLEMDAEAVKNYYENGAIDIVSAVNKTVEILNSEVLDNAHLICMLLALPETMSDALTNDTTVMGLLHLFGRMLIGNGLGAHPSPAGHDELSKAVISSYANDYTVKDETKENLKEYGPFLLEMLKEYGPEIMGAVFKYAKENGYIDMALKGLADFTIEQIKTLAEIFSTSSKNPSHKHDLEGVVEKEATCTEEGLLMYYCNGCDYVEAKVIPMLDHDFDDNGICNECGFYSADEDVCEYYSVKVDAGEGGKVVASGTGNVREGSDRRYVIIANEGYEIESVLLDKTEIEEAAGEREYVLKLKDIDEDYKIKVTFVKASEVVKVENSASAEKANPSTGSSDMVGAAVALAVVSVMGTAVLSKKR